MSTIRPEPDNPLEAELTTLRPAALTPQVVSRIAEAVESSDDDQKRLSGRRPPARWIIGALATGLAASVAVTVFVRYPKDVGRHDVATTDPGAGTVIPAVAPPGQPITLAAYHSAMSRSPEDALALLDRDSMASAPDASPRAFGRPAVAAADRDEAGTP